jgi:hypothetical protein
MDFLRTFGSTRGDVEESRMPLETTERSRDTAAARRDPSDAFKEGRIT